MLSVLAFRGFGCDEDGRDAAEAKGSEGNWLLVFYPKAPMLLLPYVG